MWFATVAPAMTAITNAVFWTRYRNVGDGKPKLVWLDMRSMPHSFTSGSDAPQNENKLF